MDREALDRAVAGAVERESWGPRDMERYLRGILSVQEHPELIGPWRDGSGPSGVVLRAGERVADWGDPTTIEMSFSATKTYLSIVAGVAFDRGLITDLDEPVVRTVDVPELAGARNASITWSHLLYQSSQWDGTLWGKQWWCDPQGGQSQQDPLGAARSVFAYNDVRINLLALALTIVWRRSLDDVLRTEVMDPIGASSTWEWHGYHGSTVTIDGGSVPVVSGGAHWGGGLWMSALDHARVGHLFLRRGAWEGEQVISERWVEASTRAAPTNPDYGMLWWLNEHGRVFPAAPRTGFCARGNLGRQLVWVDPARELVVVSRWSDDVGTLLADISAGGLVMSTVVVRDATVADVPAITTIYNALLETTTIEWTDTLHTVAERAEWLAHKHAAGHPALVAVEDDEVLGWATYGDFRGTQRWPGYLPTVELSIHVREDCWGRGVGRLLIEALVDRARRDGKHVMVAGVDAENVGSITFHERLGFTEVGRLREIGLKLGRRLDLVLMQRFLGEPPGSDRRP